MQNTYKNQESVVIVTSGSQKVTLWGPHRTPLGILKVKMDLNPYPANVENRVSS